MITYAAARPRAGRTLLAAASAAALIAGSAAGSANAADRHGYRQVNLVADQPGVAQITDPNLVNAWGLSESSTSPIWVSDAGTGVSTIYRGGQAGQPVSAVPLVVTIPGGSPTGQVFNDTPGFLLSNGSPAFFIFAGEDGQLAAWNPGLSPITSAEQVTPTVDAKYKGMALAHRPAGNWLLVADFHNGRIVAFDSTFHPVDLAPSAFRDDHLPLGYAPFNVAVFGHRVFVTYAKQDADAGDDVPGPGFGFIDTYDLNGRHGERFASRGVLNAPWGLAVAPAHFGQFSGDLLVGNFGDGRIHVFDREDGDLQGTLRTPSGRPIQIDGLWGLLPGNGTAASPSDVWFSAGPDGEQHGLLGVLRATG